MRNPNFVAYSGILMVGEARVCDKTPTAYTNGKDVVYGREFVESLGDAELRGLILHEAKHKMYRHLLTWKHLNEQNPRKANMACDYVINLEIKDEGEKSGGFVKLPEGALIDEQFRGLNSAEVFKRLPDDDGSECGGGGSLDEHDWENAQSMSADEKEALAKEIDSAIRQGSILAGKVGGNIDRSFNELLSAKVNWREALREFVSALCKGNDESTWAKPNRRWLQHDIYMPSSFSETMGRVVIAIDTSGSIWGSVLNRFISEVANLMENVNPEQVDLLYWDSKVAGHEVYGLGEAQNMTTSTKPKGGGGTSPSCITQYIKTHNIIPECVIVLTDGYVGNDWGGQWNAPVLWVLVDNPSTTAPNGSTIHLKD